MCNRLRWSGTAHQNLEQPADALQEQYEREKHRAEQRAVRNFAEDCPAEQAHSQALGVRCVLPDSPPSGGGGTIGGLGISSWMGSISSSSNNTAGAITEALAMKEPAPMSAKGAFESMKSKT